MITLVGRGVAASVAAMVLVGAVACGSDDTSDSSDSRDVPGAGSDSTADPADVDSEADQSEADQPGAEATLPVMDSCDETAAALGGYIDGFALDDAQFLDDRYVCEWQRSPGDFERVYGVLVVGHYTNTATFRDENWEEAGNEVLEDPRVDGFGGLLLFQDLGGVTRLVNIQGRQFDIRLQTTGGDEDYLPVDAAVDILLELIDT